MSKPVLWSKQSFVKSVQGGREQTRPEREAGQYLISIDLSPYPLFTFHILELRHRKKIWLQPREDSLKFSCCFTGNKTLAIAYSDGALPSLCSGKQINYKYEFFLYEQHWFFNRSAPICADILITKPSRCAWTSALRLPFSARRLIGSTLWREVNYLKMILVRPYLSLLSSLWIFDVI